MKLRIRDIRAPLDLGASLPSFSFLDLKYLQVLKPINDSTYRFGHRVFEISILDIKTVKSVDVSIPTIRDIEDILALTHGLASFLERSEGSLIGPFRKAWVSPLLSRARSRYLPKKEGRLINLMEFLGQMRVSNEHPVLRR